MTLHRKRTRRQSRRAGFTLMELMLVMAILVVLATMSTVAVMRLQGSSNTKAAQVEIETLKRACQFFKIDNQRFPGELNELIVAPSNAPGWAGPYLEKDAVPNDPWGNAYIYQEDVQNDRVNITSAGKDRQTGTNDDVPRPRI